jgi:hypothetical protein
VIYFDAEFFDLSYQFLHNISFITSAYNGGWGDIMQIGGGAVRFGALTPALSHREREKTSSKI